MSLDLDGVREWVSQAKGIIALHQGEVEVTSSVLDITDIRRVRLMQIRYWLQ